MNAYLIARFDMIDPEKAQSTYKTYVEEAGPAYAEHEARFLVRGGKAHPIEGTARARNVVIEFPSVAQAIACYKSDTYQKARRHRIEVAEGEIVIVEGAVKNRPQQAGGKGYWISRRDVADPQTYKRYVEVGAPAFEKHGALFLARGGPHQAMEGQARARNVLIEFPSVQHALDCFHSDAYQAALKHAHASAGGEVVIVEGV